MQATDVIGREITVGDFAYHYNALYEVIEVSTTKFGGHLKIMIYPKSKTSKKKVIASHECCVIPKAEMLIHILKAT